MSLGVVCMFCRHYNVWKTIFMDVAIISLCIHGYCYNSWYWVCAYVLYHLLRKLDDIFITLRTYLLVREHIKITVGSKFVCVNINRSWLTLWMSIGSCGGDGFRVWYYRSDSWQVPRSCCTVYAITMMPRQKHCAFYRKRDATSGCNPS